MRYHCIFVTLQLSHLIYPDATDIMYKINRYCALMSEYGLFEVNKNRSVVRNHVKLGVFSKDTLLFGGYWLWAWWISWGLQTCIAERSKVPNG